MKIDIADFLPKYPSVKNGEDVFDAYIGEPLNEVILHKTEFYNEKLPLYENLPLKSGDLMKSQILLSRFFSSRTMYDSLLVMHSMGTGKTCVAIAAIEQIFREKSTFNKAMIFTRGEGLLNNFINELVFRCTAGQYIPENFDDLTELEKIHRINKKVRRNYEFHTFETFSKKLKEMNDESIEKEYSNRIIVIDEVHNIRPSKKEGIETYKQFFRLCHIPHNIKVLLLSGTPMKDGPEEIAGVLNLLLPLDKLLPFDDKFEAEFFHTNKNGIMSFKKGMVSRLKDAIRGRVSYLGELQGDVKKEFSGEKIGDLKHFVVQPMKMSNFQSKHYTSAYEKDHFEKGIYSNSRQASLFVFPDGTYGTEGFDKFVIKKENRRISAKEGKKFYVYSLSKTLLDEFLHENISTKLSVLQKFSAKYAFTIGALIEAKRKGKLSFVYSEFVQGSGIILFVKLLEIFGFTRAVGNETTKAARYAVVTNQTTTTREIKNVIKRYNRPDNMHGDYISVIIGSEVISEGYSLLNVQEEHLLTPYWNYSETSQSIARGIRAGSHRDLIDAGIIPVVKIYQSVAIPDNTDAPSIDLKMYEISEIKDINIKYVERIIKESSYDCALTYERNHVTGRDGERECDYMKCDYHCDGVLDITISENKLDNSTYHLYYSEKDIEKIIDIIVLLFRTNFALNFTEITNDVKLKQHTMLNILNALEYIISHNVRIYNKYGFVSYIREENNIYFLTDDITTQNNLFSVYYTHTPNVKASSKLFKDILHDVEAQSYSAVVEKIFEVEHEEELLYLVNRLSEDVREILLEGCLLSVVRGETKNTITRDRILKLFNGNYYKIDEVYVSTLLYQKEGVLRCLEKDMWRTCTEEYMSRVENIHEIEVKKLETNEYGYYGLYNPRAKKFCIRDVSRAENINIKDRRKKQVGSVCETWKRSSLIRLAAVKFRINPPPDASVNNFSTEEINKAILQSKYAEEVISECNKDKIDIEDIRRILYWSEISRTEMCEKIRVWFEKKGLLSEDFDCGVQTKKR
jgi:superfamily II DNA or RNA helicase